MRNRNVVALLGGLGNQLFQVAFAQWLEQRTGREVRYDVSFHRRGDPDVLAIPRIGGAVRDRLLGGTRRWPTPDGRAATLGRMIRKLRGPRTIVSDYSAAGPIAPVTDRSAWWFGYWQRLEYAQGLTSRLASSLEDGNRAGPDPVIGVHVRRTDMVPTGTSVPENWFAEALGRLDLDASMFPVRVWSDDPDWCRTELRLGVPFEVASGGSAVGDMAALSSCKALLISRSTFSWWAATVASDRGAQVVFPDPWWPGSAELDQVVVPPKWIPVTVGPLTMERPASI